MNVQLVAVIAAIVLTCCREMASESNAITVTISGLMNDLCWPACPGQIASVTFDLVSRQVSARRDGGQAHWPVDCARMHPSSLLWCTLWIPVCHHSTRSHMPPFSRSYRQLSDIPRLVVMIVGRALPLRTTFAAR